MKSGLGGGWETIGAIGGASDNWVDGARGSETVYHRAPAAAARASDAVMNNGTRLRDRAAGAAAFRISATACAKVAAEGKSVVSSAATAGEGASPCTSAARMARAARMSSAGPASGATRPPLPKPVTLTVPFASTRTSASPSVPWVRPARWA